MRSQMGTPLNTEVNMKWRVLSGPPLCQPLFHYLLLVRNCNIVFFFLLLFRKEQLKSLAASEVASHPHVFSFFFFIIICFPEVLKTWLLDMDHGSCDLGCKQGKYNCSLL